LIEEEEERELRGIWSEIKHTLARERAAYVNTINSADQLIILPRFDAVRLTAPVKLAVGVEHLARDPRAVFARARRERTVDDDAREGCVNREAIRRPSSKLREPARDVQIAPFK